MGRISFELVVNQDRINWRSKKYINKTYYFYSLRIKIYFTLKLNGRELITFIRFHYYLKTYIYFKNKRELINR